ncbi:hypothetical protein INP83_11740 [Mucilaginibacter sp. 21P]|nr:hypothetical protein INP83_11740 [Mucilaginibacter sp. 21P]
MKKMNRFFKHWMKMGI